jgi:EAL and modified HD-GYP domain-containing signal transduction protein
LNLSHPEISEFLFDADFIEVESAAFDGNQLKEMYREFHAIPKHPKLIASGLQTSDEFKLCYHCGFDHYMGPFISSREDWHPAKSEINRLRVIQVLNMIRRGAEFDAIAESLRTESVLTFKLLRYINSPGLGLLQKVSEIPQALMVLGRDRFYRWLSMLLFDSDRPGYHERVLNEQVLARARFLEILAGQGLVPAETDYLFMAGLFSMLDVMMDKPLNEILKQIALPDPVTAALKGEPGPMHDAMLLAIAVESGTTDEMAAAAKRCDLDASVVTVTMIEALAWAQQMSAAGE